MVGLLTVLVIVDPSHETQIKPWNAYRLKISLGTNFCDNSSLDSGMMMSVFSVWKVAPPAAVPKSAPPAAPSAEYEVTFFNSCSNMIEN